MRCYILTGGLSSRMGVPKETLQIEGESFLQRIRRTAEGAFDEVVVVDRRGTRFHSGRVISDSDHDEVAPIFGLLRALQDTASLQEKKAWILAVDYPLMTREVLEFLRRKFERSAAECLVPSMGSKLQMLCAGYSVSLLPRVENRIRQGKFTLRHLLENATTEIIDQQILAATFSPTLFRNVNTPEDYEEIRRLREKADAHQ